MGGRATGTPGEPRRRRAARLLLAAALAAAPAGAQLLLSGRVQVEGGAPLAGAAAELLPVHAAYRLGVDALAGRMEPEPLAATATGDDGRFELAAPGPGLWAVRVAAPGYVAMLAQLDPLVEETALAAVTLRPDRGLRVLVRGPDGRPAAGAAVVAVTRSAELWRDPPSGERRIWRRSRSRGWTDGAGVVVLPRTASETLQVHAFAAGLSPARPVSGSASPLELHLQRGRRAVIEVVDDAGRPVPDALVSFGRDLWPAGLTGPDGRLATAAPAGATVSGVSPSGGRGRARLEPSEASCSVVLDEPVVILGSVLDGASREPIAGALVWSGSGIGQLARSDDGGRFALPARPYRDRLFIQAAAPGYFPEGRGWDADPRPEPALVLEPAAAVTGEVVDGRGEPVAGAELTSAVVPGQSYRVRGRAVPAHSGSDGRFRLGRLWPGVTIEVQASAAGFAPARQRLAPLDARQSRAGLRLVLTPGSSLTGRLRAGGEPVEGAELRLLPRPDSSSMLDLLPRRRGHQDAAASDAEGRFELPNLAAGSYVLRATAAGRAPLVVRGVAIAARGDTDLGVLEMAPGVSITGLVVDDGDRPVAGAEVRASSQDLETITFGGRPLGPPPPPATTDAEGRFVVPDRRRGERVVLAVSHPDLRPVEVPPIAAPNASPLRIVLERGARLAGIVVDATGAPIADAHIDLEVEEDAQPGTMIRLRHVSETPGRSDASGRFEIRQAPRGRLRLIASAPGWLSTTLGGLTVPAGGEIDGLRLVLAPGATVSGRVFEAAGRPAIDAAVQVQEVVPELAANTPYGETAADGSYRLEGVRPGRRVIIASNAPGQRAAGEIEVGPGSNLLDLSFAAGVAVSGRVVDGSGAPVAGAEVELLVEGRPAGLRAPSRQDGSFVLENVPAGRYRVRATGTGYAESLLAEPVQVGGVARSGLEITLAPGGAIAGTLLGLEADDRTLAMVAASRDGERWSVGQLDQAGGYRIRDLAAGEWNVLAMVPDGPRARGRIVLAAGAPEARLDLDLAAGLVVTGQVLLAGEPAAGVEVELRGGGVAGWVGSTTDPAGRFRLEGLAPGSYRLEVRDRRGLEHREPIELDGDRDLLVEIQTGRLAGRVLDGEDLAPLPGAGVSLLRLAADGSLSPVGVDSHLATDSGGRFVVPAVAAGTYRLQAVHENYAAADQAVEVPPGADLGDLELRLVPSGGLSLSVTGPAGTPVAEVAYAVLDAADRPLVARTLAADAGGRVRLPSVPAGSFDLLLSAPGSAVSRIRARPPGPLAVRLEPPCRLEVTIAALAEQEALATLRIRDAAGRPFRQPSWGWVQESWQLVFGSRAVTGLPQGTYTVEVEASGGRRWRQRVDLVPGAPYRLRF